MKEKQKHKNVEPKKKKCCINKGEHYNLICIAACLPDNTFVFDAPLYLTMVFSVVLYAIIYYFFLLYYKYRADAIRLCIERYYIYMYIHILQQTLMLRRISMHTSKRDDFSCSV